MNSIQRGLQILEAFTPSSPRMRFQEMVKKTGLPKVTVHRFLRTLTALQYISYEPESKQYFLSPRVMSLGYTALSAMDVRNVAHPFLEQLSEVTGQNVNLGILDGTEIVYVDRIKKRQILNIDLQVGSRLAVYKTSIGQAILAFLNRPDCDRVIRQLLQDPESAPRLGPEGKLAYRNFESIKKKGYALNDELFTPGLRAVGAPIFDHQGMVEAGINIPVFSQQVSRDELIERYSAPLLKAAEQISAARGFSKGSPLKG
jgi:IclR family pca regulon transcriptional regulator